jgi:hypothetical protein
MTIDLSEREVAILAMALRGLLNDTARRAPCGPQHLAAEALEARLIAADAESRKAVRS